MHFSYRLRKSLPVPRCGVQKGHKSTMQTLPNCTPFRLYEPASLRTYLLADLVRIMLIDLGMTTKSKKPDMLEWVMSFPGKEKRNGENVEALVEAAAIMIGVSALDVQSVVATFADFQATAMTAFADKQNSLKRHKRK